MEKCRLLQKSAKVPTFSVLKVLMGTILNFFKKFMWFPRKIFKLEYLRNSESFSRTSNAESTIRVSAITGQGMTQLTSNHLHGQMEDNGQGLR